MVYLRKVAAALATIFLTSFSLLFTPAAFADSTTGLNVAVYSYDPASTPDRQAYTLCNGGWTHTDNIDTDFDGQFAGIVAGCQDNFVLVHYTGSVTFPDSGTYAFQGLADDGFWLSLDDTPVITNDWVLKGRWGNVYSDISIIGGHTYALDAWYYEYTGGANVTLRYSPDNGSTWDTVPSSFLTTDGSAPVVVPPVVQPFLNAPRITNASVDGTSVTVDWSAPADSGTPIEHYTIDWTYGENAGWGIGSVLTTATITDLPENTDVTFWVRADNDTQHIYSTPSETVKVTTGTIPVVVPPVPPVPPVVPPVVIPDPPVTPKPPVVTPPVVVPPVIVPDPVSKPAITDLPPAQIDPQTLTSAQVTQLQTVAMATLAVTPEDSPAYNQALEQLYVAAQADDIVVDASVASVPVLGAAVVGITNTINAIGNLGSDMSPSHRAKAKKEIVAAVVATGAAVNAVTAGAVVSAPTSSSRKKE